MLNGRQARTARLNLCKPLVTHKGDAMHAAGHDVQTPNWTVTLPSNPDDGHSCPPSLIHTPWAGWDYEPCGHH
jgi:hypothetical protein